MESHPYTANAAENMAYVGRMTVEPPPSPAPTTRNKIVDAITMGPPQSSATQLRAMQRRRPLPSPTTAAAIRPPLRRPPIVTGPVTPARFHAAAKRQNENIKKHRRRERKKPNTTNKNPAKIVKMVGAFKARRKAERLQEDKMEMMAKRTTEVEIPPPPDRFVRGWVEKYVREGMLHVSEAMRREYRGDGRRGMARSRGSRVDGVHSEQEAWRRGKGYPETNYAAGTMGVDREIWEEIVGVQMECEGLWEEWYEEAVNVREGKGGSLAKEDMRPKQEIKTKRRYKKTNWSPFRRLVELWKMLMEREDYEAAAELWKMIDEDVEAMKL
ncbi:hypothetical protein UCDDS831_g09326 [Diplodia seriata]|uniref:Uncharacterized protein n=1 Tax=Diplodia seriata TaxID=420778 RepID=A0A0G2FMB7_9PEZI|nr:hypothetical protein UCDDS831_g09326 [Diplodia seriata]